MKLTCVRRWSENFLKDKDYSNSLTIGHEYEAFQGRYYTQSFLIFNDLDKWKEYPHELFVPSLRENSMKKVLTD